VRVAAGELGVGCVIRLTEYTINMVNGAARPLVLGAPHDFLLTHPVRQVFCTAGSVCWSPCGAAAGDRSNHACSNGMHADSGPVAPRGGLRASGAAGLPQRHAPRRADCEVLDKPEGGGSADAAAPAATPAAAAAAPTAAPAAAADEQAGAARTPAAAPGKENRDRTASVKAEPGVAGSGGGSVLKTPAAAKRGIAPLAGVPTPGATPSPYTPCAPSSPDTAEPH